MEMSAIALLKDLLYLTLNTALCFKIFEKVKVISLSWFTMKEWDHCECFVHLTQYFSKKIIEISSVE